MNIHKFLAALMLIIASMPAIGQLYVDGLVSIGDEAILFTDMDIHLPSTNSELLYSGELRTSGNISKSDNALFIPSEEGSRTVSIISNDETSEHHIDGNFADTSSFYNLVIDFDMENEIVDINNDLYISNTLEIVNGILRTDTISHVADGSLYENKAILLNPSEDALKVTSALDEVGPYIEGILERSIDIGTFEFPVGVSKTTLGKQPLVINTNNGNKERLAFYFQDGQSTPLDKEVNCDLGPAPDYDQPNGTIDIVNIDCVFGQWIPESTGDFNHDIILYPSSTLTQLCNDRVLEYVSVGGEIEDCPSFENDGSVTRSDIQGFENMYDIATASETSITTSTIDINGVTITTSIYPNPAIQGQDVYLEITGELNEDLSYEIYTLLGEKVVPQSALKSGVNTLDLPHLHNGQYVIRIHIGSTTTSELIFIR